MMHRSARLVRHWRRPIPGRLSTATTTTTAAEQATPPLENARKTLLKAALQEVHVHGWTQDAISTAVSSSDLPLATVGMVTPSHVVEYFMDKSQQDFEKELNNAIESDWKDLSVADRLVAAVKLRLQYVIPFVSSGQWHSGMALGATTNTSTTCTQLDSLIQSIADAIVEGTNHAPLGTLERTAILGLYVSTELHLLQDSSKDYQETWNFLQARVGELEFLVNGDSAVAATAVASSLGSAVVSLLQPAARGAVSTVASSLVPQLATIFQPQQQTENVQGTRASDYNAKNEKVVSTGN